MRSWRHNSLMPGRRSADTTPDLFSAEPVKAAAPPVSPNRAINRASPASYTRPLLPKDLAGALKHLGDTEFDALLAAITAEGERRGRLQSPQGKTVKTRQTEDASRLTSGQLNAVRAAFKAGVKPSAIARQFRISQSEVRKVLAKVAPQSKSGR
jgi:hypothetical protein